MHNFGFSSGSAKLLLVSGTLRERARLCLNNNLWSVFLTVGVFTTAMLATGCAIPRSAALPLVTSKEQKMTIPRTVWLSEIQLTDPTVDNSQRESLQQAMTMSLMNYLKESGVCMDANLLPGSLQSTDLELHITVSKYRQYQLIHPAYFPLSILTATMYIWFNGPIVNVHTEIEGCLTVKDSAGKPMATVTSQTHTKAGGGLLDKFQFRPELDPCAKTRKQFFDELLIQASRQMGLANQ